MQKIPGTPEEYLPVDGKPDCYRRANGDLMFCRPGQTPADLFAETAMQDEERPEPATPDPRDAKIAALESDLAAMKQRLDRLDLDGTATIKAR